MSTEKRAKAGLLEVCRGNAADRVPVWILRQASRYLPEHRELLERRDYRQLSTEPELVVEVTLQPVRRFELDAGVLHTDPLFFLEALGIDVRFTEDGPRIVNPVRSRSGVEQMGCEPANLATLDYLEQAAREAARVLDPVPLIGICGGPFTLAGYLVEGCASRHCDHLKSLLYNDIEASRALMGRLVELASEALLRQIRAGAKVVLLVDSWSGMLSRRDYREFALPAVSQVIDSLQSYRTPAILYVNGMNHLADLLAKTGAQVLGLDWRVDLEQMRTRIPENVSIQGNMDPAVLLGPPDQIREQAVEILSHGTLYRGHIFNLGAGILPDTPPESVQTLVDVVRDFDPRLQGWTGVAG